MTVHLYCVVPAGGDEPDPPPAGIGGTPVRPIREGGLVAWGSEVERSFREPGAVEQHDAVVRHALASVTPVPFRFGTVRPDIGGARELLRSRGPELADSLARVAGRVEVAIRLSRRHDPPAPTPAATRPQGGRAFLEERRRELAAREDRAREAGVALDAVLDALGVARHPVVREVLPAPGVDARAAVLVPRGTIAAMRDRFPRARELAGGMELTVTGPWAPYSFV